MRPCQSPFFTSNRQGDDSKNVPWGTLFREEKFGMWSKYSTEVKKIKKIALMILLLVLTAGLVGCPHWWHHDGGNDGGHGGGQYERGR